MNRWIWWVPLAVFALWWGWLGFRWGWIATTTTQTDVIEVYAQRYLADRTRDGTGEGARLTDCVAYPGPDAGVWLHVVCKPMPPDPAPSYEYEVNRLGQLVRARTAHSKEPRPVPTSKRPST